LVLILPSALEMQKPKAPLLVEYKFFSSYRFFFRCAECTIFIGKTRRIFGN
jgi:hypothetical protein